MDHDEEHGLADEILQERRIKRQQQQRAYGQHRPVHHPTDSQPSSTVEKSSLLSRGWARPPSSQRGPPRLRILIIATLLLCLSSAWILYAAVRYSLSPHPYLDQWQPDSKQGSIRTSSTVDKLLNDSNLPPLAWEEVIDGPVPRMRIESPSNMLPFTFPPSNLRRKVEPVVEYEPIMSNGIALEEWIAKGVVSSTLRYPSDHPGRRYDVVFSSVNGSDWEHRRLRRIYSTAFVGKVREWWAKPSRRRRSWLSLSRRGGQEPRSESNHTDGDDGNNRFREIGELRYAVRSAYHNLQNNLSSIHLLTPSFFPPGPFDQPGSASQGSSDAAPKDWPALHTQHSVITTESGRLQWGQLPQWLDTGRPDVLTADTARNRDTTSHSPPSPGLRVHHDWASFEPNWLLNASLADSSLSSIAEWKEAALPTFNSIAVESSLGSEGMAGLADTFVHANDDMFFGPGLTSTSFSSPLFGPLLRLEAGLLVYGSEVPGPSAKDEWPSLEHSAWLLDRRFGVRARPYVVHVPRSFKTSLLRELRMTFAHNWRQTAETRFRSEDVSHRPELSTHFLMAHFVVERYREAMLWSFFILKMDDNRDGYLSVDELNNHLLWPLAVPKNVRTFQDILPADPAFQVAVPFPYRSVLDESNHHRNLEQLGFPQPGRSEYQFTASEGGYPYMTLHPFVQSKPPPRPKRVGFTSKMGEAAQEPYPRYRPREGKTRTTDTRFSRRRIAGTLSIADCMSRIATDHQGRIKMVDVFTRWAFEKSEKCGDLLIVHLLGESGAAGMSAVLPANDRLFPGVVSNDSSSSSFAPQEPHLPTTPHWDATKPPTWIKTRLDGEGMAPQQRTLPEDVPDFSLAAISSTQAWSGRSQRDYALRLLMRYQYTIADSPTEFFKLQTDYVTKLFFDRFDIRDVGFLCLNDDYRSEHVGRMRYQFQKWARAAFPTKSPFEKVQGGD